jgi:hypothetical protein
MIVKKINLYGLMHKIYKTKHVRDIDGNQQIAQLREFFIHDCLEHPGFTKMLENLYKPENKSLKNNR